MMSARGLLCLFSLYLTLVAGHGHVGSVIVDGKTFAGWNFTQLDQHPLPISAGWKAYDYEDTYVSPSSVGNPDIICHMNATPGELYVPAQPGSKVTFIWADWPYGNVHPGPIMDYIAKCDGECPAADKTKLKWLKMHQSSFTMKGGQVNWATFDMEAAKPMNSWTITIPNIEPGNYVIRTEILALHLAMRPNGAQFYPQCINFKISGSGTDKVTGGVIGTQLYSATDPGIVYDIYRASAATAYPMPGPPLANFTYI
jgi:hypothetical protein